MNKENTDIGNWEVIYTYTREQAIDDGIFGADRIYWSAIGSNYY